MAVASDLDGVHLGGDVGVRKEQPYQALLVNGLWHDEGSRRVSATDLWLSVTSAAKVYLIPAHNHVRGRAVQGQVPGS